MQVSSDKDALTKQAETGGWPVSLDALAEGIANGDRATLARAITLIESRKAGHRHMADQLLQRLYAPGAFAAQGRAPAFRIGVTGLPGVGKSTFIDQFGSNLTAAGHKVAVLAIDPTSNRTGGSILGDKTRMHRLACDPAAFIRPSPAGAALGGVNRTTRETMLLCEAAGFDVIIVETVGVGQSETTVAGMVDFFLVLLLPGAGDELQGLKKGLVELADLIAINKSDGELSPRAAATAAEYRAALQILSVRSADWQVPVLAISGLNNIGLEDLWLAICQHRDALTASGAFARRRREQSVIWMHALIEDRLRRIIYDDAQIRQYLDAAEADVKDGRALPALAADAVLRMAGFGDTGA